MRKIFTFLLALAASVGLMNAKVTWKSCNISDLEVYGTYESYSMDGVTFSANADHIIARWEGYEGDESHSGIYFMTDETGGFTFSNTLGKNFTKIEMTLRGPGGWDYANLGSGWNIVGDPWDVMKAIWTGNASTVDLVKDESHFHGENVKRIVFYFEGDSEEPDPTYTVALQDGTANADKVTLSATSAEECTTVTVTPNEEYEITAFKATYNTTEELSTSFDLETDAYSFTMPAANVTIEATIALKPVPEGDIFAGFTATAGSGGFDNEGHANLVDNKFTSADWTKWCTDFDHMSVPTGETGDACWWIDFEASAALNLTGYILTTGNDTGNEHGRNPKNWVLKAKLNADDAWTTIATVTNDVTMKNKSFKDYKFLVESGSYKYFRFEVFANQGADVMQLCELRLIGTEASAPAPTYTVALRDGTVNADKVTLSATSAVEGATITVTPNEEYEITDFWANYSVVVGQLGTIYTIDATLDPATDAYSFTMPAADVTIDATIAEKPAPSTPTVYNSGSVALSNLNVGDILMAGVTLTDDSDSKVKFVPSRLKINGNIYDYDFTLASFVNTMQTPLLGENAAMTLNGGFTITPINEEGNDGNAWVVTEIYVEADIPVTLAGIGTQSGSSDEHITANEDPQHTGVYYSTFYDSANKYELPAGVEAYIVTTVSGDAMQLQKVAETGQTIPAGAGVIFKASVTPFTLTPSNADAVSVEGNRLEGSDESISTLTNCYVLSCENNVVGFYHYTASMLNPHKAYIIYAPNSGSQAPRHLRFVFNGEQTATGVENVQGNVQSIKVIENGVLYIIKNGVKYNAMGQEVK